MNLCPDTFPCGLGEHMPWWLRVLLYATCAAHLTACASISTDGGAVDRSVRLPAEFLEDRAFLNIGGGHIFTDTGGGSIVLSLAAAQRLGIELSDIDDTSVLEELGPSARRGLLPAIPSTPWLAVPAGREEVFAIPVFRLMEGWPVDSDGVFGQSWFQRRVWTWDYPAKSLWLRPPSWRPINKAAHLLPLTFKNLSNGARELNMPRTQVTIDGTELSVLLDTGATTVLTEQAMRSLGDGKPAMRATSMVGHRRFEEWRRSNPGWRVVEDAQVTTHARMILVPLLELGVTRFATFGSRSVRTETLMTSCPR